MKAVVLCAFFRGNWMQSILVFFTLTLFFIPIFFWGDLYLLGGDDTALYYTHPIEYLQNFSFNIISNNTLGANHEYFPMSFSAPIIVLIAIVKFCLPFFNTQHVMYGLLLSLSFVFFFHLLTEILTDDSEFMFWSKVVSSFFYLLTPYITKTFFNHQLISIYSVPLLPICLYFFVKGLKQKNYGYIIFSAIIYSLFSSTVLSLPWTIPVVITLPVFLIYVSSNKFLLLAKSMGVFLICTFMINLYSFVHILIPLFLPYSFGSYIDHKFTSEYSRSNSDIITNLSALNPVVNQLSSDIRTSWFEQREYPPLKLLGLIYFFTIFFASAKLYYLKYTIRNLYFVAVGGLLLTMFFFTPNMGSFHLIIFQWMNVHIPFFTVFRFMFDKFALAMAFHYAFALFVALYVIRRSYKNNLFCYALLMLIFLITLIRAFNFLYPFGKKSDFTVSGKFNDDYLKLVAYIKALNPTQKFIWLPLTYPGYVYIEDGIYPGNYYVGISPLQILAGASDIAGYQGIETPLNSTLNNVILEQLRNGKYENAGRILREQNIGYIIENKTPPPENLIERFNQMSVMDLQTGEYKSAILGEKIMDFGNRYTLYKINNKYFSETVFLKKQNDYQNELPVNYTRSPDGSYEINLDKSDVPGMLVFLEPFSPYWSLYSIKNSKKIKIPLLPEPIYQYGNTWNIDPESIVTWLPNQLLNQAEGYNIRLKIEFWPQSVIIPSILFSIVSLTAAFWYCIKSIGIQISMNKPRLKV